MGETVTSAVRPDLLHIVGMGAQAPIGLEPRAIAAAVRGKLDQFHERQHLRRRSDGSPIVASLLSTLDPRWTARERMRRLAIEAASQALAPLLSTGHWPRDRPMPMILSLPPVRPGMEEEGGGVALAREILTSLPFPPDKALSGIIDTGHDGGLAALIQAVALVANREAEVCLTGGVDSLRDIALLDWIEGAGRLKGEETPAGLIPGEGAAFLLVCSKDWLRWAGRKSLGAVMPPVRSVEPNPWYMGQPCQGQGLTEAVRGALEALGERDGRARRAEVTWCDLNGEHWRADEWTFAYLRTGGRHGEPLQIRHPADVLGDLGAATGSMLVLLAALDLTHPRSEAESALVFAAADTRPHRAACVVLKGETA